MSNIVPIDQQQRPSVQAGVSPQALVPTSLAGVWKFAEIVHASGMAPRDMNTPEKISVAIMHGMEVGLTPMAALQSIAVVNGRPSVWGDGAIGLVRSSGLLEQFEEGLTGEGDKRVAFCRVKRKGEAPLERTFSWDDAKKAGLTTKTGPWQAYPNRMLVMRARAFALRDAFADVLRGLSIREEMEDVERTMRDVTPPRNHAIEPQRPALSSQETSGTQTIEPARPLGEDAAKDAGAERPPEAPASTPPSPPEEPTIDFDRVYDEIKDQLATVRLIEHIAEVGSQFVDEYNLMTRSQRSMVDGLFQDAEHQLRQQAEEESRKRVEAAGGKGIKQYMDEDRQDAQLADEIRAGDMGEPKLDADDLDRPPAERDPFEEIADFPDDEAFAAHIRAAIAKAKEIGTEAAAKKMKAVWIATKQYRTLAAPVLRDQLFMELLQAGDTLKGK